MSCPLLSSYCRGPFHFFFLHLFSVSSWKYRLLKVVGAAGREEWVRVRVQAQIERRGGREQRGSKQ
jgi:hypothetical protein